MNDATILRFVQWIGLTSPRLRRAGFVAFHVALLVGVLAAAAIAPDRSANTRPAVVVGEQDLVVYRYRVGRWRGSAPRR